MKKYVLSLLIAAAAFLVYVSPAFALSVVQTTNYNSSSSISAVGTLTFGTAPTAGDLLIVGMSYAGAKHPTTAPTSTSWTLLDENENGTSAWLTVYYHIVGAGEANSYTFNTNGGDFLSMVGVDVTGQAASSFINQHAIATGSSAAQQTPTTTPSVIGTLPIAFIGYNDGSVDSATPVTSKSGWTTDQNPQPQFHSMAGAHQNALTTDTTTGISNTFTWVGDSNISETILIAPATAASTASPRNQVITMDW
jgi:hypothetical protein